MCLVRCTVFLDQVTSPPTPLEQEVKRLKIPTSKFAFNPTNLYDGVSGNDLDLGDSLGVIFGTQEEFFIANQDLLDALGNNASVRDGIELFLSMQPDDEATLRLKRFSLYQIAQETLYATDPDEQGLFSFGLDSTLNGRFTTLQGGWKTYVDRIAKGLTIKFNTKVYKIMYGKEGVTLKTNSGNYHGTHVITTVPAAVMQAKGIEFTPKLPEKKREAIDSLAIATLEHITYKWDQRFWPEEGNTILYINDLTQVDAPKNLGAASTFINFKFINNGADNTLMVWYGGETSKYMWSKLTEQERIDQGLAALADALQMDIPKPSAVYVTNWQNDPLALGSYTDLSINSKLEDIQTLSEPVAGKVFFAGEATDTEFFSYTIGAHRSGLREANRIKDICEY